MTLPYQLHHKSREQQQQAKQKQSLSSNSNIKQLEALPFWIWDKEEHRQKASSTKANCCFNHILGLPIKNNKEYPIFEFQKQIYDSLENSQNIWIKKARGIGVTTFLIRYLVWKVLYSNELEGKSIFIISGTREEFANYVKKKMEDLFLPRFPNIVFDSKYTELWINKTWIKVMPTKNIKDVRGYMDVAYLFIDEADHFDKSIQEELEPAITAYEEKSKGKTIMASTPNRPDGLFERIEKDPNSKYKKLFLGYELGLGKIYDPEYIEQKKLEPEFEREYNLKYLGKVGNVFSPSQIDKAIELGELYSLDKIPINDYTLHSVGVDFGFSSSATAIVLTEFLKEECKIRILYAEEFEKANPQEIVDICFNLYRKHWNTWFFVDGANRAAVNLMKVAFDESLSWDKDSVNPDLMKVLPVNFATEHKQMLAHLHMLINKEYLAIPKEYDKLIISLRTAYANEYSLDKEETSYSDS
ncbi:MAG: hypothetical protein ACHQ1D_01895 [Nitrososphaerales archaeon]